MPRKVVIIGAVALGPKVACRVKRLDPDAEVIMIDRDNLISYGGCGIPYFVGGDIADVEGLRSTSAHVIRDVDFFHQAKDVTVLTGCEAVSINRRNKTVVIRHLSDGSREALPYDQLVLATGAEPAVPPIPGIDLPGVRVVSNLHSAQQIKSMVARGEVSRAVVIGGGAVGIEMTEALSDLWGVETTLVEMQPQLLPVAIGPDISLVLQNHMEEKGVRIRLNEKIRRISGNHQTGVTAVETDSGPLPCDLVVPAVGVRPNVSLAEAAGLEIGDMGGIRVDSLLRTTDPDIYAGGDCIELRHLVSGHHCRFSLGSLANRQGRVIGTNICGGRTRFEGAVGNLCLKVFDLGLFRAGLTVERAVAAGFDPTYTLVAQSDRAHFYPTQEMMILKLIACRNTRRILGVEAVGPDGDAVKSRVDAVAAVLPAKPRIEDIANLEVSYSPPFASAMDIVNNAANALENTLAGRHHPVDAAAFLKVFDSDPDVRVLDVRSSVQAAPFVKKFGPRWQNIPQEELRSRLDEIHAGKRLYLVCGTGPRAYEAQLLLAAKGGPETLNVQGGMKMLLSSNPRFAPSVNEMDLPN